jgi:hypothetical protein
LLSRSYRFGFRNEGDFDLRNNAGAAAVWPRRQQGFFNNNFVTNGLSSGAFSDNGILVGLPGAGTQLTDQNYVDAPATPPVLWSSYFNNFVSPVQRRGNFPHYVMEVCPKLPVAACKDEDWFIDLTPAAATPKAENVVLDTTPYPAPDPADPSLLRAGSTVDAPATSLQRFPRRVAFARTPAPGGGNDSPPLSDVDAPQPLGISGANIISAAAAPRNGSLWFAGAGAPVIFNNTSAPYVVNPSTTPAGTTIDGANVPVPPLEDRSLPNNAAIGSAANPAPIALAPSFNASQPLLIPVPQIQTVATAAATGGTSMPRSLTNFVKTTSWIPRAVNTTFNLIVGAGDTPSRSLNATTGDFNGGLQNLPRFLESWNDGGSATNIRGSFIQQRRSAFSTAPYQPIHSATALTALRSLFEIQGPGATNPFPAGSITNTYITETGGQRIPYFTPPARNWGFDVGLLSQPPDLFTQRFTTPSTRTQPAEYFREVPRNDEWVNTLMCGKTAADVAAVANFDRVANNCGW